MHHFTQRREPVSRVRASRNGRLLSKVCHLTGPNLARMVTGMSACAVALTSLLLRESAITKIANGYSSHRNRPDQDDALARRVQPLEEFHASYLRV
jgi:hypothetical protein